MKKIGSQSRQLVSVIMCAFNAEKYILEAVNSILTQSHEELELIIVDDCSTDATAKIIKSLHDPRIRFFSNDVNSGPAHSRNIALSHARGAYIAIMDADDISMPNRLATQLRYCIEYPDCGVIGSLYARISQEGILEKGFACLLTDSHLKFGLRFKSVFGHGTVFFNTNAVSKKSIHYNTEARGWEDLVLWTQLADETKLSVVPEVLYLWRSDENSLSHRSSKTITDQTQIITTNYSSSRTFPLLSFHSLMAEIKSSAYIYRNLLFTYNTESVEIPMKRELQRFLWENSRFYFSSKRFVCGLLLACASVCISPANFLKLVGTYLQLVTTKPSESLLAQKR